MLWLASIAHDATERNSRVPPWGGQALGWARRSAPKGGVAGAALTPRRSTVCLHDGGARLGPHHYAARRFRGGVGDVGAPYSKGGGRSKRPLKRRHGPPWKLPPRPQRGALGGEPQGGRSALLRRRPTLSTGSASRGPLESRGAAPSASGGPATGEGSTELARRVSRALRPAGEEAELPRLERGRVPARRRRYVTL